MLYSIVKKICFLNYDFGQGISILLLYNIYTKVFHHDNYSAPHN